MAVNDQPSPGTVPPGADAAEFHCRRRLREGKPNAAADLGSLLFRSGRRAEAMPLLELAAGEGDPRAQYLLGIALFNGDHRTPDAERARLLLEAAATGGIAQARVALAEMAAGPATADPTLLLSTAAAATVAAQFARLQPAVQPTFESLVRELLVPLLRERLETSLPAMVTAAVNRAVHPSDQPMPERS